MNFIACRKALPISTKKRCSYFLKTLLVMKLTVILILTTFLQINARSIAQNYITLSEKKAPLKNVLKEIKRQSGVAFFYDEALIKKSNPVDINVKNVPLKEALTMIFQNQALAYEIISNKIITIKEREPQQIKNVTPVQIAPVQIAPVDIITGMVTDEKGVALQGASVRAKGSDKGATTNADGKFRLVVKESDKVLIVSFTGYAPSEVALGHQTDFTVKLTALVAQLEDIVVIGYGTLKRKDLTGSVASVNVNDLQKAPVRSFEEAITGRVAGVQASSNDGQPGAAYNFIIRGSNSVTQNNGPLFVIDGFPIETTDNNTVNPADIESIEILKDASATAIYGARGANGVILITTKKGKAGPPVISYDFYSGLQKVTKTMKLMSAYDFVSYQYEIDSTGAKALYLTPQNRTISDYKNIQGVDWQTQLFRTAFTQNHSLSINGGNEKTRYALSGSYTDQGGVIIGSGFKRYQGRVIVDQQINDKIKIGINVNYSSIEQYGGVPSTVEGANQSSARNLMYSVWGYRPTGGSNDDALINSFIDPGNSNQASDYRINPVISTQNELHNNFTNNLYANGYGEYKILNGLKLRISAGINQYNLRQDRFNNSLTRTGSSYVSGLNNVNGSITTTLRNDLLNENILTYVKKIGNNHSLNLVGGYTIQKSTSNLYGTAATALPNESLGLSALDEGTPIPFQSVISSNALVSYLARVNYSYKDRYLLTASIRSDASSKFAANNRVGYFPSGAFAWHLSDEEFMKKIKIISDSKIRLSYGITGNNRVTDFSYYSTIIYPVNRYAFNNTIVSTSQPGILGNAKLKWESTKQFDGGIDLGLFKDRITIIADYYNKITYNLLLNANLPYTTGYTSAFKNVGKVNNSGLELSISTINIDQHNFRWVSSFNISFNRNKVLALNDGQQNILTPVAWDNNYKQSPTYIAKVGQPIAMFYGYVWDGNYQYSDFDQSTSGTYVLKSNVPNNGNARTTIKPGDIKYRDLNGDGVVNIQDVTTIGNPNPKHIGGFSNDFTYKNFNLNFLFQWSYGNQIYNANRILLEGNPSAGLNQFATYNDRWTPQNQSNTYFRYGGAGPYANSSRVIEDGSFIRLKTIAISYDFKNVNFSKLNINSIRIYSSAQNLVTWTKYSGMDPEVSSYQTALTPGFDYSPYPRAFTLTFGIKVNL